MKVNAIVLLAALCAGALENVLSAQDIEALAPAASASPFRGVAQDLPGLERPNLDVTSGLDAEPAIPEPFYNLLSGPEEPRTGSLIQVRSSSSDIGLLIYGRISLDTVTSNGRLLAPFGYIFLGPDTPESQWTNVISARQSTLGFVFTGPELGEYQTLARF
jgi:hypothetical protein